MSQSSTPDKKPYETPVVTKVGKVEEITNGSATAVGDITVIGSQ